MKQRIDLNVEAREIGKSTSRSLRLHKRVPGIVYGSSKNIPISLHVNDILKYNTRAFENALFNIQGSVKELGGKVVLMKDVVVHPVTRQPEHVDLFAIDLNKEIRVELEVSFQGKPVGLSEGGILNVVNRTITIEVLPTQIPDTLSVDVSNLSIGDALHVSDIQIPAGVRVISSPETTLCVVNLLEEEVISNAAPGAAESGAAAPAAGAAAPAAAGGKAAAGGDAKAASPAKAPAKK